MKLRNQVCVLALAALLAQLLAGCHTAEPVEPSGQPDPSAEPVQSQRVKESQGPGPEASEEPTPTPEPDLWDPEHRLDFEFKAARGLELPVSGATGYATVKLPLWAELPEEEEGKLAAIYAPPEPSPEPSPESSEEPSQEPPAQSNEPVLPSPDPVPEPTPEAPPESASEAPPEPTPEAPPEPTSEALPEPTSEAPPESAPEPLSAEGEAGAGESAAQPEGGEAAAGDAGTTLPEWLGGEAEPSATAETAGEPIVDPPAESAPEAAADPAPEATLEPAPETTAAPSPEPSEEPEPEPSQDPMEEAVMVLKPGTAFTILEESGDWWEVQVQGEVGWVEHRYCLINLPDVIPSIIYNDTNAYSSVFVSSGKNIPNITGKALYQAEEYNPRLGHYEFMMPVLYAMAKNVCQAQQNALAEGNTIVLYEGYRPYSAQMAVVRNLTSLSRTDRVVKAGISTPPWNISWFIATGASNHQEGYAMDVSLAKVTEAHVEDFYGHSIVQVDEYEEYTMPTPIHELSMAAVTYTRPVAIFSTTAWRNAEMAPAMAASEPAKALQRYCTSAALTPLASEWWHFNDLAAYNQIRTYHSTGEFEISDCLSMAPA